jgi:hypothetical protein
MWSVPRDYKQDSLKQRVRHTRVEAGTNTSTVNLRVVGSDEKGSLKCETVKYGSESLGTLARACSIYKRQTRPLFRQGAPQKQDRNYQTVINIWS